jgi:hypothetical protein
MDLSTAAAWSWDSVLAGASAACAGQATSIAMSNQEQRNPPMPDTFQPDFIFLTSSALPFAAWYTPRGLVISSFRVSMTAVGFHGDRPQ